MSSIKTPQKVDDCPLCIEQLVLPTKKEVKRVYSQSWRSHKILYI